MSEYICPNCGKRVWIKKNNAIYRKETNDYIHKKCPVERKKVFKDGHLLKVLISYYKTSCVVDGIVPQIPFFVDKVRLYYESGYDLKFQLDFVLWKYELKNEVISDYNCFLGEKEAFKFFRNTIIQEAKKLDVYSKNDNIMEIKYAIRKKKDEINEQELDLSWI